MIIIVDLVVIHGVVYIHGLFTVHVFQEQIKGFFAMRNVILLMDLAERKMPLISILMIHVEHVPYLNVQLMVYAT